MTIKREKLSNWDMLIVQRYLQQIKDTGLLIVPSSKLKRIANEMYLKSKLEDDDNE